MWPISEEEYIKNSIDQAIYDIVAKTFINVRILKQMLNDPQHKLLAQSALDEVQRELDGK